MPMSIPTRAMVCAECAEIRDALFSFARLMEDKLRKNDHKKGWETYPIEAIRRLMMVEIEEFNVAREFFGHEEARKELVDIANFAMILHNRLGQLIEEERRSAETSYRIGEAMKEQARMDGHKQGAP